MKNIQNEIVSAIQERRNFRAGSASGSGYAMRENLTGHRDVLEWHRDGSMEYLLWGNKIAETTPGHTLLVSDCGYSTATTASRLNAVFAGLDIPMSVSIRNGKSIFFLNGEQISDNKASYIAGDWTVYLH